jgi:hypothetical protein
MEGIPHSSHSRPASGGLIHLQARLADPVTWLAPAWAALCGVVASGGFDWQVQNWLRLALLVLLVDGGWGTLWAALGNTDWAKPLRRWRNWRFGEPTATPPYTLPGTPGDRVSRWLGQLRAWWRDVLWPTCGPALSTIVVALPVTALLGMLLGSELLLLSIAALTVMEAGLVWTGGRGAVTAGWNATVAVMLPWLAGHVAFSPLTPSSAAMALALALVWGAAWHVESPWGRVVGAGGQLVAVTLLIAFRHPLAACCVALLLVPQLALLPWIIHGQPAAWYARHTCSWLMAAMLIAAWAL